MGYSFIQKNFPDKIVYRDIIFIPLFFTFYLVLKIFEPSIFILDNFAGRPVSIATFEGVDIGYRVFTFYKAIGFAALLFFLFTRLIIVVREYFQREELLMMNGISLAGFCLLYFKLIGADMAASFHFIFAMQLILASGFVSHQVKKRYDKNFTEVFVWTILISICLFFLQWQFFNFILGRNLFSLPAVLVATGVPIYILFTGKFNLTGKLFKSSRPLIFIPLLSFVSIEFFMILNQHGIYVTPKVIYLIGLIFIFTRSIFIYRKSIPAISHPPMLNSIFRGWIPWVLAGIGCIAFYQPIVQPEIDWFEDANHVLPLHQWFSFGKIPFLDSFSSHTLSDFSFGLLYSILNGADPMSGYVYGFLMGVIVMIVTYFFIYKITGDGFLATWLTIGYPFTGLLIPAYFNLVPLAALAFILLYEKQSVKRYVIFFSSLMFMLFWRIDLGMSTLIAGIGGLAFLLFFMPSFKTDFKKLSKGLGVTLSIGLIFFLIAFVHSGSHLFVSLRDALAYMSSMQSYGVKDLLSVHDMNYFSLYFILPAAVLLVIIYNIFNIIRQNPPDNKITIFRLAIIFLGLFYFINLQRGLVRHTLSEQWDTALTSFGYFIIASIIFLKFINKNSFVRFFVFYIAATILISNYVFTSPDLKTNNYYSYLHAGISKPLSYPVSREKIQRVKEVPAYASEYREFSDWMRSNFSPKSTFLDFSNTPMLYYYTNRIVPNYFDQIPHTAHNEYLQNRFIDDLVNFDIPVVVFANTPNSYWDNLDGIPNTLRHYRIAEYIYNNYKPAYMMNHHSIWIKKDAPLVHSEKEIHSTHAIGMEKVGVSVKDSIFSVVDQNAMLICKFNAPIVYGTEKLFMTMNVTSDIDGDVTIHYKSSAGSFNDKQKGVTRITKGLNYVYMFVTPNENDNDLGEIRISLPPKANLSFTPLIIHSTDHYNDYYSTAPTENSMKWIPYFWGAYDENYLAGKIVLAENIIPANKLIKANQRTDVAIDPSFDKSSGNYIKISAKAANGKQTNLVLGYGNNSENNGSFSFTLKEDSLFHDYLIRVSSQFNWYSKNNSMITFYPFENDVEISRAEILKGD